MSNLDDCVDKFILQSGEWIDFSKVSDLTEKERRFIGPLIDIYL